MDFGVNFFPTDTTLQPVELGRAVEDAGFDSLWLAEHSHIPVSRQTPWGGVEGAPPLPEHYWRTHDQFVSLGAIAATTERIRVCSGISLLAQRDPLWTAKEVASVDVISNGRMVFGVGYGWNREEAESHGIEFGSRRALLREKILLMRSLWTDEVASFEGELLSLEPSWAWPKPVQRPHPPIIMGAGAGPKTIAHLVEFCDGWIPLGRHDFDRVEDVRHALEDAGRDPELFSVVVYGARRDPGLVERLTALGFDEMVFAVASGAPGAVVDELGELAGFVEGFR